MTGKQEKKTEEIHHLNKKNIIVFYIQRKPDFPIKAALIIWNDGFEECTFKDSTGVMIIKF